MKDSPLAGGITALAAAAAALPDEGDLAGELECVTAAEARGYFLPDEEELVRLRYSQYLSLRAALTETLEELASEAGGAKAEWEGRLPCFATAFATACVLIRADRFVVEWVSGRPVAWKKLDEEDVRSGIPRKSFTRIYKALADPANAARFLAAADFYQKHRGGILALDDPPELAEVARLLQSEEPWMALRKRDALKRAASYRRFSFLRRNRSAWKKAMFGLFEGSGRAVAELRQPGVKPRGAPKRIHPSLRGEILGNVEPGDVFVTRHDDALSNLFLPGFWPHAALYLGRAGQIDPLGLELPAAARDGHWFLESKKDGVRVRAAEETLAVDALVVLRPPLSQEDLWSGLKRALSHVGKGYDFLFDFRTSDRLVCTEVVYRGFHGIGPVHFQLKEVGGRLCLPAEEFIDQALACGYRIVAAGGLEGGGLLLETDAERAFAASRKPAAK